MRIIVNHLTRMAPGYICVAGVDTATGKHVRPVARHRLSRDLLRCAGGPFDIGTIVDLGNVIPVGMAPEFEDHEFTPWAASYLADVAPDTYWAMLQTAARPRLVEIFGPDLKPNGQTCSVDVGCGAGSLGCIAPTGTSQLHIDQYGKVRLRFSDGVQNVSAPVTDLRLCEPDHQTPRQAVIADLSTRIARGVPVILSVGLARAWRKDGDNLERHWLQVNGIHMADNPVWQLDRLPVNDSIDDDDIPPF